MSFCIIFQGMQNRIHFGPLLIVKALGVLDFPGSGLNGFNQALFDARQIAEYVPRIVFDSRHYGT